MSPALYGVLAVPDNGTRRLVGDELTTRGVMPIGRMGTAEEVAGAIYFFASDDSALCQGAVLSVDGGFVAQ